MPLREISVPAGFVWVYMLCVLLCGCTHGPDYSLQTRAALERLDAEFTHKPRYQQWRQEKADALREQINENLPPVERAELLYAVSQSYVTYNLDSAAYYADLIYDLADRTGSRNVRRLAILTDIDVWLGRGQHRLAEELFRKIDTAGMTQCEYPAWHSRYNSVASRRYEEADDPIVKNSWQDTLSYIRRLPVPFRDSVALARMAAMELRDRGEYQAALQLLEPYTTKNLDYQRCALLYYIMAGIADKQGDDDLKMYYLAESSIADLRAGTRSYASLYDLALELFDLKDYDRATAYMGSAFDDAIQCKSVSRIPHSSSAAMKINDAVTSNIAERQKLMTVITWLAGIFLLVLIVILWYVLWQHRRLRGNHDQLIKMSRLLQDKNGELQAKNDHIHEINSALVDSNRIKDRYVCHYIDLSVRYIKQMEDFRREVSRIARSKGVDELLKRLNSTQTIDDEYQKFYQSFDSSFLDIFPNFIEQVNTLLQPESRFLPRSDSSLTTELRILAAIRLGITDSGHIASLLNCASATVYTYRTKLRNAALDRENFEEQVSKIGL
ncbi:DUF6377 domain-containing protein [uncultured Alistipes sp.]|jgi:hypothetical protein|uniref:DUF6377 domain-containing protein n=1 Tax=uncultured Alistipes sp. TaxID=538949 RepID=UPI0025CF4A4A|nr:DUF6377 domain-containing protein [uncultured Alistipes sp.]